MKGAEKTKSAYEELLTTRLLSLAIALRTKFYQGLDHRSTISHISHCGLLYRYKNNREETLNFSMKDVCDKIIHADSIIRYLEPDVQLPTTTFSGADPRSNSTWELSMSVSLFAEAILNWIHCAEAIQPPISSPENNK